MASTLFFVSTLIVSFAASTAMAQSEVRLSCGKLGLVTLSNQFTLITYADGSTSKRVNTTAAAVARGTVDSASTVRFVDGTVMSLRAALGSGYLIQKQSGGQIACTRK